MYLNLRVPWYLATFIEISDIFQPAGATEILIPPENGGIWEAAKHRACC